MRMIDAVAAGVALVGIALIAVGVTKKLGEAPADEAPLTDAAAIRAAIPARVDPVERDILRMRLVVMDPSTARTICPEVEGEQARAWCADVSDRGHLWIRGEGKGEGKAPGRDAVRPIGTPR